MKIIKLKTAEISEASFSDTTIHRGERLNRDSVLHLRNHFKPTEIFQFTFYVTCHPAGAKKGFAKRKESRLLGMILQNKYLFRTKLVERGRERQREHFINTLSKVKLIC